MTTALGLDRIDSITSEEFKSLEKAAGKFIILVRHEKTPENDKKIWAGSRIDESLTPQGRENAEKHAKELFERTGKVASIYSSEAKRAQESARPYAQLCGTQVQILHGIHEGDHGSLTGLTPDERKNLQESDPYYKERESATLLQKYYRFPVAPDAEISIDMAARVLSAIKQTALKHLGEPTPVVIYTHGGR